MPEIASFAAIRFGIQRFGKDVTNLLAPPYDVLDQADKDGLLAKDPHNIVSIDLPHLPPKSVGPPEAYQRSGRLLEEWLADGTLVRDSSPAIYLYHQKFSHEGAACFLRAKWIARARLTPFSDGVILPHEQTFGGPKEDRLALMRATRCNLSPVFGLYSDPRGEVAAALSGIDRREPDVVGVLDGVENRLWVVSDRSVVERVVLAMASRKVYIADGHHRYETALRYRDEVAAQAGTSFSKDHPAQFIMMVLASMDDPGCLILPYHRVLPGMDVRSLLAAWSSGCRRVDSESGDLVLFDGRSGDRLAVQFTARGRLKELEPSRPAAWHQLDTAYLHRFLIDELLNASGGCVAQPGGQKIEYVKSGEEAIRVAREQNGVALLMKATPMSLLRGVSEAGGLMPQKSTYFYPKLATGLTINPLS